MWMVLIANVVIFSQSFTLAQNDNDTLSCAMFKHKLSYRDENYVECSARIGMISKDIC